MSKTRLTYSDAFRRDAVELLRTSEKPLSQVARDLGVSDPLVRPEVCLALLTFTAAKSLVGRSPTTWRPA